jgi:two-component system repressor protein LuxO
MEHHGTTQGGRTSILLVEDSASLAIVYQQYLSGESFDVRHVATGAEAVETLKAAAPDILLLDLRLPDMSGMDILRQLHDAGSTTSAIVITAHGSVDIAVDAMRFGVFDFLVKPFDAKRLLVTVRNCAEQRKLRAMVEVYHRNYDRDAYHGFLGRSLGMQTVYRIIDSAAPSKATVFITGESGTGKEVCAEAIHQQSPRRDRPFVALNCAAIPRELMESEIFGHTKGAFTGASAERRGAASEADGGTLFLDEICEMELDLQSKLLRFIQTGTFQRVGSGKVEKVDVRFICATNRDPLVEVEAGRFREDLFYRLHVIPVHLPPLRERDDDALLIARHLLAQFAREEGKDFVRYSGEAAAALGAYSWPGNVRELQNVVRNVVVLHNGAEVGVEMLPATLRARTPAKPERPPAQGPRQEPTPSDTPPSRQVRPLWIVEKEAIEAAIEASDGNVPRAAALLEISASTIYRKLKTWSDSG